MPHPLERVYSNRKSGVAGEGNHQTLPGDTHTHSDWAREQCAEPVYDTAIGIVVSKFHVR